MWSEETREGVIAKIFISGKKIRRLELVPYKIYDYAQPRIFEGDKGRYIIERMLSKSKFE
jgi:starvation-inducible outer membrane lipoprotein